MDTKALRQKILDLAIRGKLVPQDPNDEPASVLLERIRAEKQQMVKEGKLKPKDIKNDTVIYVGDDNLHYEKFPDGTVKCIEDEIPFELPEGWSCERLCNIASFSGGKTPSTSKAEYWGNDYLWITSKDMKSKYIDSSQISLSEKGAEIMQIIAPDTLLLVARSGILRHTLPVAILKEQATINQDIKSISLYDASLIEFIYSFLKGMESKILLRYTKSGTTVENINFDEFKSIIIPIPPKAEQIQIIEKINTLLSFIDTIESDKTDLQSTIPLTKSKILDLAIRGKLVPQDPTDEPASVLLERIKAEKEELIKQGKIKRDKRESVIYRGEDNSYYPIISELPKNWSVVSLLYLNYHNSEIINPANYSDEWFELYSVPNYELGIPEMLKGTEIGSTKQTVMDGDVLLCKINPRINRVWTVNRLTDYKTIASSEWIVFRNKNLYSPYICFFLSSPFFRELLLTNVSGVGGSLMRARPDSVKKYPVFLPPYNEQKRIADKVSQLFSILDDISESVN